MFIEEQFEDEGLALPRDTGKVNVRSIVSGVVMNCLAVSSRALPGSNF